MSLQDKLDAYRAEVLTKRPPHIVEVMHRATAELIASGQAERALKPGDRAHVFTLPGPDGTPVASAELLAPDRWSSPSTAASGARTAMSELQALQDAMPKIGHSVPRWWRSRQSSAANSRKSVRQNDLSFPILTDRGNEVGAAFGLRFRLPDELIEIYKSFATICR